METRPPLTRRQTAVLDLIRTSVKDRGYPPSVREIGDAVGLSSTSSVAHVLKALEARGYLHREPGTIRTLTITDDPVPDDAGYRMALSHHRYGTTPYTQCNTCPGCGTPSLNTTVGITRVAYTFEVCDCRDEEHTYDHLVEQLWHRDCLEGRASGHQG